MGMRRVRHLDLERDGNWIRQEIERTLDRLGVGDEKRDDLFSLVFERLWKLFQEERHQEMLWVNALFLSTRTALYLLRRRRKPVPMILCENRSLDRLCRTNRSFQNQLDTLKKILPSVCRKERERVWVSLILSGVCESEIARRFGISRQCVNFKFKELGQKAFRALRRSWVEKGELQ